MYQPAGTLLELLLHPEQPTPPLQHPPGEVNTPPPGSESTRWGFLECFKGGDGHYYKSLDMNFFVVHFSKSKLFFLEQFICFLIMSNVIDFFSIL